MRANEGSLGARHANLGVGGLLLYDCSTTVVVASRDGGRHVVEKAQFLVLIFVSCSFNDPLDATAGLL